MDRKKTKFDYKNIFLCSNSFILNISASPTLLYPPMVWTMLNRRCKFKSLLPRVGIRLIDVPVRQHSRLKKDFFQLKKFLTL